MDYVFAMDLQSALLIRDAVVASTQVTAAEVQQVPTKFGSSAWGMSGINHTVEMAKPVRLTLQVTASEITVVPLNTVSSTQVLTIGMQDDMSVVVDRLMNFSWDMNAGGATLTLELLIRSMHPTYEEACAAVMERKIRGNEDE